MLWSDEEKYSVLVWVKCVSRTGSWDSEVQIDSLRIVFLTLPSDPFPLEGHTDVSRKVRPLLWATGKTRNNLNMRHTSATQDVSIQYVCYLTHVCKKICFSYSEKYIFQNSNIFVKFSVPWFHNGFWHFREARDRNKFHWDHVSIERVTDSRPVAHPNDEILFFNDDKRVIFTK